MNDFEDQYKMLNDNQRKAVDTINGPVIVIAGPGTGKTQILTLRIANILKKTDSNIGPENILALTFTTAGVVAMRERLSLFVGVEKAYRTNIYTFHSFCQEQISLYSDYFPNIIFSTVATDVQKINIVQKILKDNNFSILKTFASNFHYIKDILHAIDELKRDSITPQEFINRIEIQKNDILADEDSYYKRDTKKNKKGDIKPDALKPIEKNKELQIVYALYQKALLKKKLYDFTDMIMQFVEVAENNEEFASILREQYQYVLVDEHQDTNEGQNRIIEVLTSVNDIGKDPNLFTVGDDKQAIYRFQGASVENFLHFKQKFDSATIINLENNYRSAQGILDRAHTLICAGEAKKKHTELKAFKKDVACIEVRHFNTYRDELVNMAEDIQKKINAGVKSNDIAVFYREHNNMDFIKEVFEKKGLPFVVISKQNILDNVQIQKLLLLLKVIDNPLNDELLAKTLLTDLNSIKIDDALLILEEYKVVSRKMSLYKLLQNRKQLQKCGVSNISEIDKFVSFIKLQINKNQDINFLEFFEQFTIQSGFLKLIFKKENHIFLLRALERLFDEVRDNLNNERGYKLKDFIEYLNIFEEYNLSMNIVNNADVKGVNLMSAHGSKGLEFEHVYITNVVNGLWGGKRKSQKFNLPIGQVVGDMEDERRLFYVAITRAKQSLTISYADYDIVGKEKMPSLFISDIDANLIDVAQDSIETTKTFFVQRIKNITPLISLEYISDKFLTSKISATMLNNYFESPLLYFFRNLICVPSTSNKVLVYGTLLHATLEDFFNFCNKEGKILPKSVLLDSFQKSLRTSQVPADYYDEIEKKGSESLSGYYNFYRDEFNVNVIVEKKIKAVPFSLDSGQQIILTGAIDKMEIAGDGSVYVVDYKTGKPWSKLTKDKKEALKRQVVFYKLLLSLYNNEEYNMTHGVLDFVEPHPITGVFEREIIAVCDEDVLQLQEEINVFANEILSGKFLEIDIKKKFGNKSLDEYITLLNILKENNK
jgi:DNA helicase-2/ATP-dependent DNA helicase PcrA